MPTTPEGRRPLTSRNSPFFIKLAAALARAGVSPNAISFTSIIFGIAGGISFALTPDLSGWPQRAAWLAAGVFIQLRLIANLLDGMVAVEGRRGGPTGNLWNEAPDRVADAAIFIGAGFAAGSDPMLGMAAALLAVFVAYIRALGASVGAGQIFIGPMAKPHRMFVMTVLSVGAAIFPNLADGPSYAVQVWERAPHGVFLILPTGVRLVLVVVILGCVLTSIRRLRRIAAFVRTKTP